MCLILVAWRAHPDYRGEQSYDLVANAAFVGIDHPSRAFLALAASYRHLQNAGVVARQPHVGGRGWLDARADRHMVGGERNRRPDGVARSGADQV